PQYGWRSVLLLGGMAPLVLTLLLLLFMPESIRYMVSSNYPVVRIRGALQRISRTSANASSFIMQEKVPVSKTNNGIRIVLSKPYMIGTFMLWTAFALGVWSIGQAGSHVALLACLVLIAGVLLNTA